MASALCTVMASGISPATTFFRYAFSEKGSWSVVVSLEEDDTASRRAWRRAPTALEMEGVPLAYFAAREMGVVDGYVAGEDDVLG